MKTVIAPAIVALFTLVFSEASAQSNALETTDQARQRHSSERYQQWKRSGTPLGGYQEKLGDVAPQGTERPGYTSPKGYGSGRLQQGRGGLLGNTNPYGRLWRR